jgi:hypothetical protein
LNIIDALISDEEKEWGEIFDNRTGNGIIGAVVGKLINL